MIRVLLSALFGLQLRLSYFVTRRPEIWDRAPWLTHHTGEKTLGETMQSLNKSSRRCAHAHVIFSPPHLGLPMVGADREAIVFTTRYVMQRRVKEEHTVGLSTLR